MRNCDKREFEPLESAKLLKFFGYTGIAILVVLLAVEILFLVTGG